MYWKHIHSIFRLVGIRALFSEGLIVCKLFCFMMLTRLKLTRGEGQLVEPSSQLVRRRTIKSPQVSRRYSPSMAHEKSHGTLPSEEETFKKALFDMAEMVKVLFDERNERLQGESSNPPKGNGDSGDKNPKGNGGSGDYPPPSSTSSTISQPPPNSPKGHGKTPLQTPFLKLDIKFELPMYNGEVNAEKLDKWIRQIEVYCRMQRITDD
jgi:hypothetical protein